MPAIHIDTIDMNIGCLRSKRNVNSINSIYTRRHA